MEDSQECPRLAKDVSLQELRDRLAEFARVRGWEQYHSPRNLLLALVSPKCDKYYILFYFWISFYLYINNELQYCADEGGGGTLYDISMEGRS